MKRFLRTRISNRWLLVINSIAFAGSVATAQCPAGSFSNTAGTYTNGQTICISNSFNGSIMLNNGATMVIVNGGNYTGNISTNNGSTIQVQMGGTFAPGQANNFSASLQNNGTVIMNNVSLSSGASITNSGDFIWQSSWNQNSALTVSNTACGTMTFNTGTNLNSGATILNNGILNFQSDLNSSSGSTINNRGRVTVNGNFNSSGLFYNQNKAVFKGSNNNINSGDSIVNLAFMTFTGSMASSPGIRNEGLITIGGSYMHNSGTILINNSNAQLRVNGAVSNNAPLTGEGSLYIAGGVSNNNAVSGRSSSRRLTVNQNISGATSNLTINNGLAAADTATYNATMANPDICTVLPVSLSSLQADYQNGQVQLNWYAYASTHASSFTIEYSRDGRSFTSIGEVPATGNNNQTIRYQYTHYTQVTGTVYYRVRETDVDANMHYTNVILVKTMNPHVATQVFPNPFTGNLHINLQLQKAGMIQIALYDASGKMVKTLRQTGFTGNNTISVSHLTALLPGVYLMQVTADEHNSWHKLIK
jgi:hypothetical protein